MEITAAEAIKERRRSMLWSVRRLAREAGISPAYMSQIESGKRPLTPRATGRIAEALGVPPHDLLAMAGFLSPDRLQEAKAMAQRAMRVPEMVARAHGRTDNDRRDWLVDDYLLLLGEDPSGRGIGYGPGGNLANWQLVDPELPESRLLAEASQWAHDNPPTPREATAIEGWDELSDSDRRMIQQLVNKLRRATADDE